MKILILTPIWRRPEVVQVFLHAFESYKPKGIELQLLPIISDDDPEYETFLEMFKDQNNPANLTGWEDPEYTKSIEKAQNSSSLTSRNAHLKRAEEILATYTLALARFLPDIAKTPERLLTRLKSA